MSQNSLHLHSWNWSAEAVQERVARGPNPPGAMSEALTRHGLRCPPNQPEPRFRHAIAFQDHPLGDVHGTPATVPRSPWDQCWVWANDERRVHFLRKETPIQGHCLASVHVSGSGNLDRPRPGRILSIQYSIDLRVRLNIHAGGNLRPSYELLFPAIWWQDLLPNYPNQEVSLCSGYLFAGSCS